MYLCVCTCIYTDLYTCVPLYQYMQYIAICTKIKIRNEIYKINRKRSSNTTTPYAILVC